jgi:LysR family transcriptional regulator, chromosome initiation inhibitor
VTPSAVSQRIRALESTLGQVLVQRSSPCVPTPAGERLVGVARQTQLLLSELSGTAADGLPTDLPVAVNADSLATWFRPMLDELGTWDGVALRLFVEDQAFSGDLLRRGEALAAVSSDSRPVQGCRVERLGTMRYVPAASPAFAERWRGGRGMDWAGMPVVVFNEKDDIQHSILRRHGVERPPVMHRVPTSADFHESVRRGLGWAAIPEAQLLPDLDAGQLVVLSKRDHVDVELMWHRWRLDSPLLARLTDAVRAAAASGLRR